MLANNIQKFWFPGIRRIWPQLVAQEIVSVQPMSLPSDLIYHMDSFNDPITRDKQMKFPWIK